MPFNLPILLALSFQTTLAAEPVEAPRVDDDRSRALELMDAGDVEGARQILTSIIVKERMQEAQALMADGQARDALMPLDELLRMAPKHGEAWFLRGQAAFATALEDSQPLFFYKDALENIETSFRCSPSSEPSPERLMIASRAAFQNSEFTKALNWATRGMRQIDETGTRPELSIAPERTVADASYRVYIEKKQGGQDAEPFFDLTEQHLSRLLGRTADDVSVWSRLAELYQWEEDLEKSIHTIEAGLALVPESGDLHEKLSTLARTKGGRKNVLAAYGRFNTIHPESPMGVWYTALETMYVALDSQLQDGKDSSADYEQAEAMFQLCRQLEPGYEANCISYELICRNGIGWCRYNNGDLAGSKEAFLSMEALKTGGLEWALGTQLFSGVMGLQFIAGKHAEDGQKADSLRKASEIFDYLHAYRPEDADFANNTGFFNRDTAVLLDIQAQMNFERAKTAATANEAKDMSLRGEELRSEAQTLMERSYAAYQEASRLGPDDVRVVNDTGLIMTYYLCNDVEAAERYLYSATEMGEVQVAEMRAAVEELRMQVALEKDDLAAAAAKADIDVIRLAKVRAAEAQLAEARRAARDLLTIEEQKLIPAPQPDAALEVSTEAVNATDAVTEVGPTDLEVQLTELEDKLDNLMEAWGDAYQNLGILYLTVTRQPDRALPFLEKSVEIGPLPRVPRGFIRESLIPICKEAMSGKLEAIRQVRGVWHHNAPKAKQ